MAAARFGVKQFAHDGAWELFQKHLLLVTSPSRASVNVFTQIGAILLIAMAFRGRYGVRVRSPEERGLRVRLFEPPASG